jgi:hypothetical protein
MINCKIQINDKIKIKHKACGIVVIVAIQLQLKDLTHMICLQDFTSQII